nr:FtsX-like permease family protein [Candidatus Paceibacterota bacterium]
SIEKINYNQNKNIIDKLNDIMDTVQRLGLIVTLFFIVISILITFNTIRLAIYGAREEIAVMRLVGADKKYIRGPFMVEGILYGIGATFLTVIISIPITLWFNTFGEVFFGGMDIFAYYITNLPQIFIILLVVGVLLGIISSFFATRRYLKK